MNNLILDENGRVRSGWRVAIFLLSFVFLSFVFILGAMALLAQLPIGPSVSSYLPLVIPFCISSAIAIGLGAIWGKLFENLPFRALGCSFRGRWLANFAIGCLVGALALGSAILVAVVSGALVLTVNRQSAPSAIASTLAATLAIFIAGAVSEETLFRGYLLQTLVRSRAIPVGIGLTSVLFAFAHNTNPGNTRLSWLNTFFAGIWFAAAYLKTRDLWFPMGIHLMWNWLQGPVFGINVSGIGELSPDPLFRATDAGPGWLTGGSYGIEGGIACTFALVVSLGLIYFLPGLKPDLEMLALSQDAKPKQN